MSNYSLIFVIKGNKVLMINRKYPPVMGTWCGLGGHIEDYDKTSLDGAYRELLEEANITRNEVKLDSIGLYPKINSEVFGGIYKGDLNKLETRETDEGILSMMKIKEILSKDNLGVTDETKNIVKYFIDSKM